MEYYAYAIGGHDVFTFNEQKIRRCVDVCTVRELNKHVTDMQYSIMEKRNIIIIYRT